MFIEFMRHGSNAVLLIAATAILGLGAGGVMHLFPLWVVAGALLFHLSEYGTHRYLFHAEPSRLAFVRRMQHRLHYDHHTDPNRLDLLFLPLWYVVPNMAVTALAAWAILGSWAVVASLVLGATLALLHYEWVHFAAHCSYRPRTGFGRWMKKYHLWHHFKNERLWFGVSNPVLDFVWRTYKSPDAVAKSATTRDLHKAV